MDARTSGKLLGFGMLTFVWRAVSPGTFGTDGRELFGPSVDRRNAMELRTPGRCLWLASQWAWLRGVQLVGDQQCRPAAFFQKDNFLNIQASSSSRSTSFRNSWRMFSNAFRSLAFSSKRSSDFNALNKPLVALFGLC